MAGDGLYGNEDPWFTLDPTTIGVPSLVTAAVGVLVTCFWIFRISLISDQLPDDGTPERKEMNLKIRRLGEAISQGATTFLIKEYTYLAIVALSLFVLVAAAIDWRTGICYLVGCFTSAACGFLGMKIATYR